MFYAISREMSGVVAPSALSVEAVLGVVSLFATAIALNIAGVRVFSDHVLTLVGRLMGLGPSGYGSGEMLTIGLHENCYPKTHPLSGARLYKNELHDPNTKLL